MYEIFTKNNFYSIKTQSSLVKGIRGTIDDDIENIDSQVRILKNEVYTINKNLYDEREANFKVASDPALGNCLEVAFLDKNEIIILE